MLVHSAWSWHAVTKREYLPPSHGMAGAAVVVGVSSTRGPLLPCSSPTMSRSAPLLSCKRKTKNKRFQLLHAGKVEQANLMSSKVAWDFRESVEVDSWVFCLIVSTAKVAYSAPLISFLCNLLCAAAHFQAFSIIWLSCQQDVFWR